MYAFRDTPAVFSFVRNNPSVTPVLYRAPYHIGKYFDDSPALFLQVVTDPEESDADRLHIFIQSKQPVDEAIARLRKLGMAWWLHVDPGIRRRMTIDIESADVSVD